MPIKIDVTFMPSEYEAVEWYSSRYRIGLDVTYFTSPCTWEVVES